MNVFKSLFTLLLFGFLALGFAQENDKENDKAEKSKERKAKREQLEKDMAPFLEKYFPGRKAELKTIEEQDGKKALKKAQRVDRQIYQGFKERTEEDGLEHAAGLMHLLNIAREMQAPLAAYKEAQGNVKKQAELRQKLEPLFAKQHGLLAVVMTREIKKIEAEMLKLPQDHPMAKLAFEKLEGTKKDLQKSFTLKEDGRKPSMRIWRKRRRRKLRNRSPGHVHFQVSR